MPLKDEEMIEPDMKVPFEDGEEIELTSCIRAGSRKIILDRLIRSSHCKTH